MSRTSLVAGNWKMNKTVAEARELVAAMSAKLREIANVEKVVCPPFIAIPALASLLEGSGIGLGVQNLHWEEKGAFTGEVAPGMVKEFCQYVIIGHSERRAYFGETDESVNRKLYAAMKIGLTPIVCVGETLQQYEAGTTAEVVRRQISVGLAGVDSAAAAKIVVAYEPVWAIGTGKASSAENANSVHKDVIRPALTELFGAENAQAIRILYGGSVTAANAAEYFTYPDIDGALVGGASLKPDEFVAITKAAVR
ncbi:MAG TPA: triose-phosphate isomerase [Anaerolineales bacterium]|nr:triose-phosphate isomerase [Anaerolineales bacterium]